MQPVRRPLRVVRIKNGAENESVANVQRIMQGPAYQEKSAVRQRGMPQGAVVGLA